MTKNILTFFVIFLLGCSSDKEPLIIGSWSDCTLDGTYRESKITSNYLAAIWSSEDSLTLEQIRVFRSNIQDSLLILTSGVGFDMLIEVDTYSIKFINPDLVQLTNKFGSFELQRLCEEIKDIDTTNYEKWGTDFISEFLIRSRQKNCLDPRTKEEQNPSDLGTVDDNFVDIIEIPFDS